jgi:hypothetical protein
MDFYSVRDLRTMPKKVWGSLAADREAVITNNGKPTAYMIDISESDFDDVINAVRQAKATITFNKMRQKAASYGFLSDEEIDKEIIAYRLEKNG